jgi:hypothetical protein
MMTHAIWCGAIWGAVAVSVQACAPGGGDIIRQPSAQDAASAPTSPAIDAAIMSRDAKSDAAPMPATPAVDAASAPDAAARDSSLPSPLPGFDVSRFVKVATPTCLDAFQNKIKVPPGERIGYSGDPPPNTVVDMRGVTVKFAPPGESAWGPSGSDNVCVVGARFVGQSARTISWRESKDKYDGSGIRVAHLMGPFIWENVIFDNSHDAIMLPRAGTPSSAKGIVRSVMALYNRDDCIEDDGSTSTYVDDSYFECNTFFSATGGDGAGREFIMKNSLVQMKCMPEDRLDEMACAGITPRAGTGQLWKGVSSSMKLHVQDSIIYQQDRTKNGLSSMRLNQTSNTTFQNVVIVWGGAGDWPGPDIPPGVTITKDLRVWESARAEWMRQHGCNPDAADCAFAH